MNILTPNRAKLPQPVSNALDKILSAIGGVWSIEHHDDGTHGNVTADSLTVAAASASKLGNVTGNLVPTSATSELGYDLPNSPGATGPFLAWLALHVTTVYFETFRSAPSAGLLRRPSMNATSFSNDSSGNGFSFALSDVTGANTHGLTIGAGLVGLTSNRAIQGAFVYSTTDVQADTGVFERGRSARIGEWTTFTPTRTASAGTWTAGTVTTAAYMLVGKTMTVTFYITGTSVSNAGVTLRIAIPGGFTAAKYMTNAVIVLDAGAAAYQLGNCQVAAAGTVMEISTPPFVPGFNIAVTNTDVVGQITFEVQ